nr:MAG TPA: hypothetical protein [Caudoviricetes sp.]
MAIARGTHPHGSFQRPLSFACEPCRTVSHCPGATRPLKPHRAAPFHQPRTVFAD